MKTVFFFISAAVLACCLWIFPGWFDSGELALAVQSIGVSHPTGHPLYILLGKFFTWLPFGSVAFRVALFSAVSAAFAAAATVAVTENLTRSRMVGLAAGCVLLLHASIALQVTRVEVYAPQLAAAAAIAWAVVRASASSDARFSYSALFLYGLSMGIHPVISLSFFPLLLPALMRPRRMHALAFFALGVLLYLYLPLRASVHPQINWDEPTVWRRFWGAITAFDFQHSVGGRKIYGGELRDLWGIFPLPAVTLACVGAAALWSRSRGLALALILGALASLGSWAVFDFTLLNPDVHGYSSVAVWIAVIVAAVGAAALAGMLMPRKPFASAVAASLLLLSFFPLTRMGVNGWRSHAGEEADILSQALDRAPAGASLETGSDHWLFPFWYRTGVEGRRPDVEIVGTGLLPAAWYRGQVAARYGSAISRPSWRETEDNGGGWIGLVKERFLSACARISPEDPFAARRSVCAQVILTWVRRFAAEGKFTEAASLLERAAGAKMTGLQCARIASVFLPFPLYRDGAGKFLADPDGLKSELMLLYLGCGREDLAAAVAPDGRDTDALLLRAAILWRGGKEQEAFALLDAPVPVSRRKADALKKASILLRGLSGSSKQKK